MLQTNNTGVRSQCLSHTGSAPAHGACSLPAHTARALGCSTRNNPKLALGCMHLPGPSRSGSGTRVVLRGTDSVGLRFVLFPGPSSSGDEVFGERQCCDLSPPHHCGYLGYLVLFLYCSSVYSCHLFLISSTSVKSLPFLFFTMLILA